MIKLIKLKVLRDFESPKLGSFKAGDEVFFSDEITAKEFADRGLVELLQDTPKSGKIKVDKDSLDEQKKSK